jgi:hypothetical protein
MSAFQKGNSGGGRKRGARDRISSKFLTELADDFEKNGHGVVAICRVEKPVEYLTIIASVLPKELEITDSRLQEIDDAELDALLALVRQRLIGNTERRENEALN